MTPSRFGEVREAAPIAPRRTGGTADGERGWNEAAVRAGGHLLQSWQWGELKHRHGWEVERVRVETPHGRGLAQVLFRHRGPVSQAYVPRGPVLEGDRGAVFPVLVDALDARCRDHRALSLIVESNGSLGLPGTYRDAGFVRGPEHYQPSRTVKVPLLDDEALLGQMHQKTRYNVRLAQRRGVTVEKAEGGGASLDVFYDLLRDTSERNEFGIHDRAYYDDFLQLFGDAAVLLFARIDGVVAAAVMSARFGSEAVYMYGGSSTKHRAHGAAFLLQFEAMRWAREAGCNTYDLWGIPSQDPAASSEEVDRVAGTSGDDWRGLYIFKVRFGGEIVGYPPSLERRYRPVLAWAARRFVVGRG